MFLVSEYTGWKEFKSEFVGAGDGISWLFEISKDVILIKNRL